MDGSPEFTLWSLIQTSSSVSWRKGEGQVLQVNIPDLRTINSRDLETIRMPYRVIDLWVVLRHRLDPGLPPNRFSFYTGEGRWPRPWPADNCPARDLGER